MKMNKAFLVASIVIGVLALLTPAAAECEPDEFECTKSGKCIPMSSKCDQWVDCPGIEQEDEEGCPIKPCPYWRDFQCDNGVCILGYQKCNTHPDCKNGEDERCGPHCTKCNGWKTLKKYGVDCESGSRNPDACEATETCVTRLKRHRNRNKIRAWLGCMEEKRCKRLEKKNHPGCSKTPVELADGEECTFCCSDRNFCNEGVTKEDVIAI